MTERVNKLYKPAELQAAIRALETNTYNPLPESEARAYVKALHAAGWRVVFVGTLGEGELCAMPAGCVQPDLCKKLRRCTWGASETLGRHRSAD